MRSPKPMSRLLQVSALAGAALLTACFQTESRRSGVDDFPNSIYARVSGFMDESKKADSLKGSEAADSILLSAPIPVVPLGKANGAVTKVAGPLAKLAAPLPPCVNLFHIVTSRRDSLLQRNHLDSLAICVDSAFTDTVKNNEHIARGKSTITHDNGRVEIVEVTDADGDGYINLLPGGQSKVRVRLTTLDKGVLEQLTVVQSPGPDNNLDAEADNVYYELRWSKTQGADTLGSAVYSDPDSDGVLIDNGKPSLVKVVLYQKGPTADDPNVVWSRLTMVMISRYNVEPKEMKGFKMESETKDGRLNFAVILSRGGGETFDLRDTVLARFRVVGTAASDTVDTMQTELLMNVGKDFDAKTDDSIFAIKVAARKKLGEEKSAVFEFVSDKAIPSGKDAESGTVVMRIEYTDGTSLKVDGAFANKSFEAVIEDRQGKKIRVRWDEAGKVLTVTEL